MAKARNDKRRGRWFETITGGRYKRLVFEAETATSTKAVVQTGDTTGFPHIELDFVMTSPDPDRRTGEIIDQVRIYLTLDQAITLDRQLHASVLAATPRVPGR